MIMVAGVAIFGTLTGLRVFNSCYECRLDTLEDSVGSDGWYCPRYDRRCRRLSFLSYNPVNERDQMSGEPSL